MADKSRKAAFELIREIGNIMLHNRTKTENENISEYFELLLSGFAGSTEAISASMLAISHAVHEFHNSIPKELLEILMQNVILLLGSNVREIIQSVFGFLKVILSSFTDVQVGSHIPKLIKGISGLNDNLRRHFRTKIKDLFTGLIRKFGYAMIIDLVPEDDAKLLQNIRKTEDRKKRQKKEKREIMSEERKSRRGSVSGQSRAETVNDILDELASTDEEPEVQDKHIKKSKVYIADDNEEDIVDFTDPKASQKISGMFQLEGKEGDRVENRELGRSLKVVANLTIKINDISSARRKRGSSCGRTPAGRSSAKLVCQFSEPSVVVAEICVSVNHIFFESFDAGWVRLCTS